MCIMLTASGLRYRLPLLVGMLRAAAGASAPRHGQVHQLRLGAEMRVRVVQPRMDALSGDMLVHVASAHWPLCRCRRA
jgi:hypothetical protein